MNRSFSQRVGLAERVAVVPDSTDFYNVAKNFLKLNFSFELLLDVCIDFGFLEELQSVLEKNVLEKWKNFGNGQKKNQNRNIRKLTLVFGGTTRIGNV